MKSFNINKARTNLFKLDCVSTIVSGITILLSSFLVYALRMPDAVAIMKIVFIASLVIFAKSIYNIKGYLSSKDTLYKYL